MLAVDTSILIYAHRSETGLHQPAAAWLVTLANGVQRWALPVFCIAEFMRVVTHQRAFNRPSTLADAAKFIEALTVAPACEVIQPGPEFLQQLLATAREAEATGNLIFDAQIAALCYEHGVREILTNDDDFRRFQDLRVLRLA
jgi:toxin-antitoxin system PIN domain toxin